MAPGAGIRPRKVERGEDMMMLLLLAEMDDVGKLGWQVW